MARAASENSKGGSGGLVGFIVVTLLAVGVGVAFGLYIFSNLAATKADKPVAEAPKPETKKPTVSADARLIELAPVVVNLAEPRDVWMRLHASILVEGMTEGFDVLSRNVGEDIAAYLKTTSLAQFEGPSGFQSLREDLTDRARVRDGEHIKDLIIHGLIVE